MQRARDAIALDVTSQQHTLTRANCETYVDLTERQSRTIPQFAMHENPDDRAGAVLRAPGHAVQRIPPHPRAARAGPYRRSRHVSVRHRTSSLPGLRVFRCLRPPFVHDVRIGPSLAKVPLDFALALTDDPPRAVASGTTPCTRTRRAASSASSLAAMLGVPHLYDMHSSLPQQLTQFRLQPSRGSLTRRVRVDGALRHPPLEGRHRDLPAARGDRARHRPRRADGADRERAGLGRCAGRRARARASVRELGLAADAPIVLYTGTFEAYQGLDLLFAAARVVLAARPTRGSCSPAAGPIRSRRRDAQARAAGVGRRGRSSPVSGRPRRFPAYLDAADVLVSPRSTRHEHAAEDLPVPAVGPADRRDAAADAYAGARRRRGVPDGGDAGGLRRGDPGGARPIRAARARGRRARAAAGRNEVQLRGLPDAHAPGLRAPDRRAHAADRRGRRVTDGPREADRPRSLQLLGLRRSGDGGGVRRAALQRSDRPADRRDAGAA